MLRAETVVSMDRTLVERAQSGDREAFSQLVQASSRRLLGVARLILRDSHRAEDAVQDALMLAWRDIRALRDPLAWDAWVRRLTVNACYKAAGKEKRRTHIEATIQTDPQSTRTPDSSADVADREWVLSALGRLSLDHRAVITLHYYLDLPMAEVANILDIPYGTAASRLHRGLESMRVSMRVEPGATSNPASERAS
jgi:RNA polymerase sigma factor (sigma-70 family)